MPNRIVRDGILRSKRVNALTPGAEIFYRRLMSVADDYGRFEADPTILRSSCYPLTFDSITQSDVEQWLAECCHGGEEALICTYTVKSNTYLVINKFDQRQRTPSKYPQPIVSVLPSNDGQMTALARASHSPSTTPSTTPKAVNPNPNFTEDHPGYWAERMYGRHPKKKNLPLVQMTCAELWNTKTLSEFREIDRIHALWCDTDDWRKSNGKFCPKLDEWLMDRGWTKQPELDEEEDPEAGNRRYAESQITAKAIQEAEWRKNPL